MTLLEAVRAVFEADGFPVEEVDGVLRSAHSGPAGLVGLLALTVEAQGQVVVYAVRPELVPQGRHAAVAALCAHESSELAMSGVEIDRDHGQVRVRSSLDLATVRPAEDDLRTLVRTLLRNTVVAAHHVFPLVDAEVGA